jgi:hypothetical protein
VQNLREKARTHAANNSFSCAPLIDELAGLLEEWILSSADATEFDKGFAAGHQAGMCEAIADA